MIKNAVHSFYTTKNIVLMERVHEFSIKKLMLWWTCVQAFTVQFYSIEISFILNHSYLIVWSQKCTVYKTLFHSMLYSSDHRWYFEFVQILLVGFYQIYLVCYMGYICHLFRNNFPNLYFQSNFRIHFFCWILNKNLTWYLINISILSPNILNCEY